MPQKPEVFTTWPIPPSPSHMWIQVLTVGVGGGGAALVNAENQVF